MLASLGGLGGLVSGGLGLMSAFGSGRRGNENPGGQALGMLNRNPAIGHQYYDPFIQQGQEAGNQLFPIQNQFAGIQQQMGNNPTGFLDQLMSQYKPSEGYKYREKNLMQGAHNTAASGGFAGTEGDVRNRSELVNSLMGQDMQQFLQNVLGIQGQGMNPDLAGLGGLSERVGRGYNASSALADYLGDTNSMMASAAGSEAGYRGQSRQQRRSNIYNSLSSLIGGIPTGGGGGMMGGTSGGVHQGAATNFLHSYRPGAGWGGG